MEQYVKGFKGFTPVKMCGLSPLASFYFLPSSRAPRVSLANSVSLPFQTPATQAKFAKEARTLCSVYQLYRLLILLQNIYVKN